MAIAGDAVIGEVEEAGVDAGYVEAPNWDVSLRKGHHEGLIDLVTFEKMQSRLQEGAKAPARKDINAEFPLRGFVSCGDCERPLTACWSKSKTGKKHPYYLCFTKGCPSYRKSIPRDRLEGEFDEIVRSLQPTETLVTIAKAMFNDAWTQRLAQANQMLDRAKADIRKIDAQIDQMLDRIVEADSL